MGATTRYGVLLKHTFKILAKAADVESILNVLALCSTLILSFAVSLVSAVSKEDLLIADAEHILHWQSIQGIPIGSDEVPVTTDNVPDEGRYNSLQNVGYHVPSSFFLFRCLWTMGFSLTTLFLVIFTYLSLTLSGCKRSEQAYDTWKMIHVPILLLGTIL